MILFMEAVMSFNDIKKYILDFFYTDNPFVQNLQIRLAAIEPGSVTLEMDVVRDHTNVYGIAHGGATMTMADTAMGASCLTCNKRVVTLDCNMNYMRAVPVGTHIRAKGHIIHNGSRTMVCDCDVMDDDGNVYMRTRGTFFVKSKFIED